MKWVLIVEATKTHAGSGQHGATSPEALVHN